MSSSLVDSDVINAFHSIENKGSLDSEVVVQQFK